MNSIFCICLVCVVISCKSKDTKDLQKPTSETSNINNRDTSTFKYQLKNDTICYENLHNYKLEKLRLLRTCHIILNDTVSTILAQKYSINMLPIFYNFDIPDSSTLSFEIRGDTISVRKLYLVFEGNYKILLDTIVQSGKHIYLLRQKHIPFGQKKRLFGAKYEEFYYEFLLLSKGAQVNFYASDSIIKRKNH